MKKPKTKTYYAAEVTFRFRNASGEMETKTIGDDVTDSLAEGADSEHLVDIIFWNQIAGKYDAVEIISGGVYAVEK